MNLIKSYLFVPANKPHFLSKSLTFEGLDYRILDFEDSVSALDMGNAIKLIQKHNVQETDWVRIPLNDRYKELASKIIDAGLNQVVLPKVVDKEHVGKVLQGLREMNDNVRVIILIENARMYVQLEEVLKQWNQCIFGIGLGSHDFSAATKIRHTANELFPLRLQISVMAKAYGVIPIDIASMNISDEEWFKTEIQSAYDLGFRAKFILHPFQLHQLQDYAFFSEEEVKDAEKVLELFSEHKEQNEVVLKYKGNIYEKPHIAQLKDIKAWGVQFYGTNR